MAKKISSLAKTNDFPLLSLGKIIYLDNSATTQKPSSVIQRLQHFYTHENANVHRAVYPLSQKATMAYESARETVASFVNASPEEIIFTSGTTASLNGLAQSLGRKINPGDEIVLSMMEHHSNIVPWQQLAQRTKAVLKYIPLTADFRLDISVARRLITSKTKIVSVAHISNVLGTINPITELARLAHAHKATFIVDAAQSVLHLPLDVREIDCDFLAFSGHKVLGPTGIGVLYGKKQLLEKMEPFAFGGGMISEVHCDHTTWADVPSKFEAGTPPIAEAVALATALEYISKIGRRKNEEHAAQLTAYALEKMKSVSGLTIIGPATSEQRAPVISFTLDGIHPHDVVEILARQRICVRGGHHCAMPLMETLKIHGTTRASFTVYNNQDDVDALIKGLSEVKKVFQ